MKSLQEYKAAYALIAQSNNLTGKSVQLLIDMLSYNSYDKQQSEVNSILESSLDRAI